MKDISKILKPGIKTEDLKQENGILCCMNDLFISGDNQKYMKNVLIGCLFSMIWRKMDRKTQIWQRY